MARSPAGLDIHSTGRTWSCSVSVLGSPPPETGPEGGPGVPLEALTLKFQGKFLIDLRVVGAKNQRGGGGGGGSCS